MTLNDEIADRLKEWVSTLENPVEPKITEWLKKNLRDKYTDDIDMIIIGAKGDDTMIGKYQIKFDSYLEGICALKSGGNYLKTIHDDIMNSFKIPSDLLDNIYKPAIQ